MIDDMQSFILSIVILSNFVGGIEVASDVSDVWADFGVQMGADGFQSELADSNNDPLETDDCDHCCHSGAHFAGFAVAVLVQSFDRNFFGIPFLDNPYHLASSAPPTPPPNV